jgi:hypothetical protein
MPKPLTIAQLTDVHLGPIRGFTPRHWNLKRLTGYLNWQKNRRNAYQRAVLDRLVADLRQHAPDHIVVTGDLANIGLPAELMHGLDWLRSLGEPHAVSVIPGNHDIYGHLRRDPGTARWAAYMASCAEGARVDGGAAAFPMCAVLGGGVALIGVNSRSSTPPMMAWGEVGAAQRERLGASARRTGRGRLFRLVLIHHPPLPGQARPLAGIARCGRTRAGSDAARCRARHPRPQSPELARVAPFGEWAAAGGGRAVRVARAIAQARAAGAVQFVSHRGAALAHRVDRARLGGARRRHSRAGAAHARRA